MLTTILYGLLIVVAAVVVALAGLALAQRLIPLSLRMKNNTATGTIYAALYVMFGVSLGFSLFLVWQQFNTARQTAENEATSVQQSTTSRPGSPIRSRTGSRSWPSRTPGSSWRKSGPR